MLSEKRIGIIFSFFLILVSIWIIVDSYKLTIGSLKDPGPGYLPFFAGLLMLIFVLVNLKKTFLSSTKADWAISSYKNLMRVVSTLAVAIITAVFFENLGFFVMGVFFLIMLMKVVNNEKWVRTLMITIFAMVMSYLIFIYILDVQLPSGPFGK
jgi:putative tricarboxylic transport membrane protein